MHTTDDALEKSALANTRRLLEYHYFQYFKMKSLFFLRFRNTTRGMEK